MPRKRTKSFSILKALKEGALSTTDIFINIALEPLRHSYKGTPALLNKRLVSIRELSSGSGISQKEKHRLYSLLTILKKDGLIASNGKCSDGKWVLSEKGRLELEKGLRSQYKKEKSQEVIVISYDIPEKNRKNRNWLRSTLKLLDFKMLHQSTWIGKTKMPEELLEEFRIRKITNFIHIFTIGKGGTLTQII